MDKIAIKAYAVEARCKLIEAVKLKAGQLYIFEDSGEYVKRNIDKSKINDLLRNDGIFLTSKQLQSREKLYKELLTEGSAYKPDIYNRVMENIACTWFNRLIALRIMEVNEWLPSNIRILSSREQGRIEPDAVREVERLSFVSQSKVAELRANTDFNADEKLYKYILISQCNELSKILPGMFEKENDYTELLLPDALLVSGGIVNDLVNRINEDNFNIEKRGQIEIIGWLYQYYISEKKDEVFAGLKKNVKITKDTIPAATQLFTPEWIVKYMVENSLGRLWLESHPNQELRENCKYYLDETEQTPEVMEQLQTLRVQNAVKSPEEIKLIDPCMGSGHILVYAFDVLFQIYQSAGYSKKNIPNLILQNNIHGLDIDDRAGQLAYFALMMKARSYNRRFFRQDNIPQPMVYSAKGDKEISEYGSLLKVDNLGEKPVPPVDLTEDFTDYETKLNAWNYQSLLAKKYDVVCTNPPYMSPAPSQANFIKKNYPNSKSDLCVVFIERNFELLKQSGYLSMITMHSWMFLSSYKRFREKLIDSKGIVNMAHLGARAFEEIGGEVVQTTAFVIKKRAFESYNGCYVRLVDINNADDKETEFLNGNYRYTTSADNFAKIPGSPVAYWLGNKIFTAYESGKLFGDIAIPKVGMQTSNNEKYLRLWFEINYKEFNGSSFGMKWIKYLKGGNYRKWYGNLEYLLFYNFNPLYITQQPNARVLDIDFLKKSKCTWTDLTSGNISFRLAPSDTFYDISGHCFFPREEDKFWLLAYANTKLFFEIKLVFNSTFHCQVGDVARITLPSLTDTQKDIVSSLSKSCVEFSRTDWDSFETSWDFKRHPLVAYSYIEMAREVPVIGYNGGMDNSIQSFRSIKLAYEAWKNECNERFATLKANEEELNRIFIDIYGLQDELTPEVEDKDVTVRKADLGRDIRSFISYAVGCMFGRYSLDEEGLVFAGGEFDKERYKTFIPEDDNIIPIGSTDYFDDDIVVRFVEFVCAVYGDDTLGENLTFIADALYPNANGTAQERIRRYFLNDFYKDHCKIYQKRPIYWLMSSGKQNGFKALFYLHRYDKYTVAMARTDYLHPLQRKYEAEIKRIETLIGTADNAREKTAYRKEIDGLRMRMDECRVYDQVVAHIAHQQIALDLDDGVKVNYAKFQGVEVPLDIGKTVTMDLFAKI